MADDKAGHEVVGNQDNSTLSEHDPHFEPIITLPEVTVSTMEEDEIEMIKLRAKLFRYDTTELPPEWKERGTGDVKLLRHSEKNCVRVVMRRDKTLKICANHYVTPWMELKPNCGSDRAWVYSVPADYADEEIRPELLAIKFANSENAKKWKDKFEEAKMIVETQCELYAKELSKNVNLEDDDDADDSGSVEETEPKSDENTASETDKVTCGLEKLKVDEKETPTSDKVAEASSNGVDNQKESTAAD
ncbi:Ran-specific GTPase-activating protein [Cryptotermes secundus]|uniref:Ran-specific GTPase-activating protein n=2 Tax=Cryptotermes secundus TaxID=105785 RepID=A0A2J7PX47_9NEOP|nr:ran-specific GTPase-activating protein [Cryptotermes secundus]PNF20899.1 Ran-specific GTPase-activating protein [Cryptotermes secundus]